MELPSIKALSALALMLLTFFASMLPLCIFRQPLSLYDPPTRYYFRRRILSFFSCFAGGVFLGTCLLHLLPDVAEQVNHMVKSLNLNSRFPITEFLVGAGFLIILIVEQIVLYFREPVNDSENDQSVIAVNSNTIPVNQHIGSNGSIQDQNEHSKFNMPSQPPYKSNSISYFQNPSTSSENEPLIGSATTANPNTIPGEQHIFEESIENSSYIATTYGAVRGQNQPSELNISFTQPQNSNSTFHYLLLLFALSLHAVFEGLAIGLQTTVQNDLRILLAVLIHKCIIAFSLGLKLTYSEMKICNVVKSNFFFSLTSPIGILVGMAVINLVKGVTLTITSSILQGLAAGTFLYITIFEILPKEFNSDGDRMFKVLSVLIGYIIVTILVIALPD